jgi:phosphoglycerol transferase MdoB-like AlkP superfamily enzyme
MEFKAFLYSNYKKRLESLLKVILIVFALALITNALLQYAQMVSDVKSFLKWGYWLIKGIKKFLVGSLFIFFIYLFIISIIGNLYFGAAVSIVFFLGIAYSNSNKLKVLGEPLYPVDFYQIKHAKVLFEMIGGQVTPVTILLAVVIIAAAVKFILRLPKLSVGILSRGVLLILSAYMIYSYVNYNKTFVRAYFKKAGIGTILWNQRGNYDNNGFVFGMLCNLQSSVMKKPEPYDEKTVLEAAEKYVREAEKINKTRNEKNSIKPNIIFIMNEAFWDPTRFTYLKFSEDPMKNLRKVMKEQSSGWLLSPIFGGNTANAEFEALTGLSMYNVAIGAIPYQQAMERKEFIPSLVSILEKENYDTLAIHPYKGMFYKRDRAYSTLGINEFLDDSKMKYTEALLEGTSISDQSATNEVIERLKESTKPTFIHLVTMQNHFPFYAGKYGENSIAVTGLSQESTPEMESYAEAIKQSAIATKNLIDYLEKDGKPTLVVFFGDHLPSLSKSIYEEAGYKSENGAETERMRSETPLFIYSNFHLDKRDLKTVSPMFLGPIVFEMLNKPVTPYYAMLNKLQHTMPGLKTKLIIGADNKIKKNLTKEEKELLKDYKLLQYDVLIGKQYSLPLLFGEK